MADPFTEGHIVSEQQRESALGAHINTFKSIVSDLGYSPSTIRSQLNLLRSFTKWVQGNHVVIAKINEGITDRFLTESGRKGAIRRGDNKTPTSFSRSSPGRRGNTASGAATQRVPIDPPKEPVRRLPTKGAWAFNGNRVPVLALYPKIPYCAIR